ncbi:hypothetical protein JG687_00017779 [Phytophthora cactorum]|uniref:Uncharacterized protein n=1 Tax=Phytophthora cactorum TaxID=29920 RepID=A0A8T1TRM0_9STRA|nr:hypothetical protein JG687_00017779 [Phytophthora cactorum]
MSGAGTLGSRLDSASPLDERPLLQFQGSVSEWSDMRITCDKPCSERMIDCKEGPPGLLKIVLKSIASTLKE